MPNFPFQNRYAVLKWIAVIIPLPRVKISCIELFIRFALPCRLRFHKCPLHLDVYCFAICSGVFISNAKVILFSIMLLSTQNFVEPIMCFYFNNLYKSYFSQTAFNWRSLPSERWFSAHNVPTCGLTL